MAPAVDQQIHFDLVSEGPDLHVAWIGSPVQPQDVPRRGDGTLGDVRRPREPGHLGGGRHPAQRTLQLEGSTSHESARRGDRGLTRTFVASRGDDARLRFADADDGGGGQAEEDHRDDEGLAPIVASPSAPAHGVHSMTRTAELRSARRPRPSSPSGARAS